VVAESVRLLSSVVRPVVISRKLSKIDHRLVTMEHSIEVGTADSIAAFTSSPRHSVGRYSGFK